MQRILAALAAVVVLFAGCITGGDGGASPSPTASPEPPLPPLEYSKELKQCPPSPPYPAPVVTTPINEKFTLKDGYDTLIIGFHVSGQGTLNARILQVEGNKEIWTNQPKQYAPPTYTVPCGSHSHTGGEITKTEMEPGEYNVRIDWSGPIAAHLMVVMKSSRSNMTGDGHHNATFTP